MMMMMMMLMMMMIIIIIFQFTTKYSIFIYLITARLFTERVQVQADRDGK